MKVAGTSMDFQKARVGARPRHDGFTSLEVIGSMSLLMAVMATTIPLFVRHGHLLAESRRERIAIEELANQAERLAGVPVTELDAFLERLVVSPVVRDRLPGARLTGIRDESPLGERVVLSISWDAVGRREHPLSLVVWPSSRAGVSR